jgi:hypothetical protein
MEIQTKPIISRHSFAKEAETSHASIPYDLAMVTIAFAQLNGKPAGPGPDSPSTAAQKASTNYTKTMSDNKLPIEIVLEINLDEASLSTSLSRFSSRYVVPTFVLKKIPILRSF